MNHKCTKRKRARTRTTTTNACDNCKYTQRSKAMTTTAKTKTNLEQWHIRDTNTKSDTNLTKACTWIQCTSWIRLKARERITKTYDRHKQAAENRAEARETTTNTCSDCYQVKETKAIVKRMITKEVDERCF